MTDIILDNDQQRLTQIALKKLNMHILGHAGTGKSVTLKAIIKVLKDAGRNVAVLAPTGLAALNISGVTIHSFFKLSTEVLEPDAPIELSSEIQQLIECIDTIVIDEISMVRADIFNHVYRIFTESSKDRVPWNQKQIIVCGDFLQLPPVVPNELRNYFNQRFNGIYAFNTEAWEKAKFANYELTRVYRQLPDEKEYVSLLEKMRKGFNNYDQAEKVINRINCLCTPEGIEPSESSISICTTNSTAQMLNQIMFDKLSGERSPAYIANEVGNFPSGSRPVESKIILKCGMRVMLVANKYEDNKPVYMNGDIGSVTQCNAPEYICVKLDSGKEVKVEVFTWESFCYSVTEQQDGTLELKQKVDGYYSQIPVKPAYAISIHKSQGQSFDTAKIYLNKGCFANGQAYIAFSRCRSAKKIKLDRPLQLQDIQTSREALEFYRTTVKKNMKIWEVFAKTLPDHFFSTK